MAMSPDKSYKSAIAVIYTFQFVLVILFAIFCKYDKGADALTKSNSTQDTKVENSYPMFQDIHVMIFIGFGFLMTFLRRYGFGAIGFTFLIAAVLVQWGILCYGFFRLDTVDGKYSLDVTSLMTGDIIAAAALISFGALLGKTSPLQLLIMGIIETALFAANEYLGAEILKVVDAGGSIFVHTFGAYFGLAVSLALTRDRVVPAGEGPSLESSNYQSDISAMIGTVFLWLFWPSFNAGLLDGNERHRAVINTYLSLAACCAIAFATSSLVKKNNKFDMVHIQNSTLAGGVCVGSAVNMMLQPYGALLVGSFAGVLSTLGYEYVQGYLLRKFKLHDTCGVNNLHGMPGVAAALISALMAALANEDVYGESLFKVFPAMDPSVGRSASQQAGYQLIALVITLVVAIVGGLMTGVCIRNVGTVDRHFDDVLFWHMPEDEEERASENGNKASPTPGADVMMLVKENKQEMQ